MSLYKSMERPVESKYTNGNAPRSQVFISAGGVSMEHRSAVSTSSRLRFPVGEGSNNFVVTSQAEGGALVPFALTRSRNF